MMHLQGSSKAPVSWFSRNVTARDGHSPSTPGGRPCVPKAGGRGANGAFSKQRNGLPHHTTPLGSSCTAGLAAAGAGATACIAMLHAGHQQDCPSNLKHRLPGNQSGASTRAATPPLAECPAHVPGQGSSRSAQRLHPASSLITDEQQGRGTCTAGTRSA